MCNKIKAELLFFKALKLLKNKYGKQPLYLFFKSFNALKPLMETKTKMKSVSQCLYLL
jgi:ribosomal protein S7